MLEVEAILKLSRNKLTVHQAQKIAKESYWKKTSFYQKIMWGTFKGKSIQSYMVAVDLSDPISFRCNCSSAQNPCKHGLGLLLFYRDQEDRFKSKSELPAVINKWQLSKTVEKDPRLLEIAELQKKEKAALTRNTNREKRIALMRSGAFRLQEWIQDVLKRGLAELEGQPLSFWEEVQSRVVDHKLGGISRYFIEMQEMIIYDDLWIDKMPHKFAWLNQVLSGLQNFDQWKPEWQNELLRIGGVTTKSSDLQQLPGVEDDWGILHSEEGETDNGGYFRKSWMLGKKTHRLGYQLDYNYQEMKFPQLPKPGRWFSGEVVFYPGPVALRFILRKWGTALLNIKELPGVESFSALNAYYLANMQLNPWLLELPVVIQDVIPSYTKSFFLRDKNNQQLSLPGEEQCYWKILAISAGAPIAVFGIWNGYELDLKGISKQGVYFPLN